MRKIKRKIFKFFNRCYSYFRSLKFVFYSIWFYNVLCAIYRKTIGCGFGFHNMHWGTVQLFSRIWNDFKKFFKFWFKVFKSYFVKGKRFYRWCELLFFLIFPFIHFGLFILSLYKHLFIYMLLIIDIFTCWLWLDIKWWLHSFVKWVINTIMHIVDHSRKTQPVPEHLKKTYDPYFKQKWPIFHDMFINKNILIDKKILIFFDKGFDIYIKIKRIFKLIFFDSIFTYIPLFFKKLRYWCSFEFAWYAFCTVQNRIDLYLYLKLSKRINDAPMRGVRKRKRRRRIFEFCVRVILKIRDIILILWHFRVNPFYVIHNIFLFCYYFKHFKIMLKFTHKFYYPVWLQYKKARVIYFYHIFVIKMQSPFKRIYYLWRPYAKIIYHDVKLKWWCYNDWTNIYFFISTFKLFILVMFHHFMFGISFIILLPKRIYNFLKKIIILIFSIFSSIFRNVLSYIYKYINTIKKCISDRSHSKWSLRIRRLKNFMNIKKKKKQ